MWLYIYAQLGGKIFMRELHRHSPSPTADATRLSDGYRALPTAKTPGIER